MTFEAKSAKSSHPITDTGWSNRKNLLTTTNIW